MRALTAALVAGSIVAAPVAHGLDVPVDGKKLVLKVASSGAQKLTYLSRDPDVPFPAVGGPDDPAGGTPGGLVIDVFAAGPSQSATLAVPAGTGRPGWTAKAGSPGAYVFSNASAPGGISVVRKVALKQGRVLKIAAKSLGGLGLTGPQASVGIRVTTGSLRSCALFGPGTIRRDQPGVFIARDAPAAALADCSDASLGGSASGTTSTTSSTTTSLGGGSTTSTSLGGGTTTSTTLPVGAMLLDFTTTPGSGACGAVRDAAAAHVRDLACGGLDLGGGDATVPEGAIPDGATSRFLVTGCVGTACTLSPSTGSGGGIDCTSAGCRFGPPLPIPNGGLSTCVINTFAASTSGSVDLATGDIDGSVPLASRVYVTGNATQPCPRCSASGQPGNPGVGTCTRGANEGGACSSTNSTGLSGDCPPGGGDGSTDLGELPVDLTPLATSPASEAASDGLFCPGQTASNAGCFGEPACREFELQGLPAGPLASGETSTALLASTFCIPATGNLLIDGAAGLPGPGAASLPGLVRFTEIVGSTTSTSTTSSTSTSQPVSTSTIATTSTTTSTLLPPLLPARVELASVAGGGACGVTRDGGGGTLTSLACGDMALGGGASTLPPSTLPDGAVNQFMLGGCGLFLDCALLPVATPGPGYDCTSTGCFFGAPVPVPNGGLSACALSTFAAPASGSVNLLTGATSANVLLDLHLFVTGNGAQPCPRCSAVGAPGAPGAGTCDRGANAGGPCTTTNSQGLSKDCQPGGADGSVDLGSLVADLSPVTTGTAAFANPGGLFCPSQANAGCFGDPACRSIQLTGMSPGVSLVAAVTPQPATLVSTFCIPSTGNVLIDGSADLPGPAAISVPGLVRAQL